MRSKTRRKKTCGPEPNDRGIVDGGGERGGGGEGEGEGGGGREWGVGREGSHSPYEPSPSLPRVNAIYPQTLRALSLPPKGERYLSTDPTSPLPPSQG